RQICLARIKDNIVGKVQNPLQSLGAHIEDQAHTARNPAEVPDVRNGCCEFDVPHPLTADLGAGHLDAALVTNNTLITDLLILSASTLPVLSRTEDFLTEQTVAFGFQGTI